jgi:hypothetical protein
MEEFQSIKGMKIACKGFNIKDLREFWKPHVKQTSSNIDHKHWRNPTVMTGVFPHSITSQIPGAEGCRGKILEIEANSSARLSC